MAVMVEYQIHVGDTLQSISQKLLGDASKWHTIAVLNNLDYPFVSQVPIAGKVTKSSGDVIYVPVSTLDTETSEVLLQDPNFAALGTDLDLEDGELGLDINGDLRLVSGVDNLYQDLMNRLSTEVGTLTYHPEFGSKFTVVVGNKTNRHWLDKASVEIAKVFKSDPRVIDVKDLEVNQIADAVYLKCTIIHISGLIDISEQL